MSDDKLIIVDTNLVEFDASSYTPKKPIPPIVKWIITASGKAKINGLAICVEGDEKKLKPPPHPYNHPGFPIPGVGQYEVAALENAQTTEKTLDNGKKIIIKGAQYDGKYTVNSQAKLPTPAGPQNDAQPNYTGKGKFIQLINKKVFAG